MKFCGHMANKKTRTRLDIQTDAENVLDIKISHLVPLSEETTSPS